jgi:hypothetical protein
MTGIITRETFVKFFISPGTIRAISNTSVSFVKISTFTTSSTLMWETSGTFTTGGVT